MLSNRLGITKIVVLTNKAVECFFKISSAYLFKLDREQLPDRTLNRCLGDLYPVWFLTVCKRIGRTTFAGWQFDKTLRFQNKKQASADHIFKNAIGLSPVPYPANFLRNKASASVRICRNNLGNGCDISLGD